MEKTSKKKTSKPYSPEFHECAVRLVMEHRDEYQSEVAALTAIAGKLNCSPDSLYRDGIHLTLPRFEAGSGGSGFWLH
ncbi:hypothetical protein [Pannonibacter indicus]|jgi:transposase-like protein|uniref:hypothetical protein n=1 Tax=Pannonibacter indicus TaxID=466044 RepID=UPI00391A045F